jgi:peroxiredoxin
MPGPGASSPARHHPSRRRPALPCIRRLAAAAVLSAVLAPAACMPEDSAFRPLAMGDPAPAFAVPDLQGDTLRLADLRGVPVLLNIWATWCPPCREEMPGLQALHEAYGAQGLRVIGVSVDSRGAESAIRSFAEDHHITFTLLHDMAEQVPRQFRTTGVPETFLIDASGVLAHRWIGAFDPLAEDVTRRIEALLAQQ